MAHIDEPRTESRDPLREHRVHHFRPRASPFPPFPFTRSAWSSPSCGRWTAEGYQTPTPIQAQAIPHLLRGRDLLGCARTGTGKTAAFALPILDRFARAARPPRPGIRALVLAPTRELALQVHESFTTYGGNLRVTSAAIFGGVGQGPQVQASAAAPTSSWPPRAACWI
jgi:superfamily II DNA/RNA helicase